LRRAGLRWWPVWAIGSVLGLLLTVWFSLRAGGAAASWAPSDKVQHAFGYLLLSLWFLGLVPRERAWRVAAACIGIGVLMELLQGWLTATRQADVWDALANAGGVGAGLVLARLGLDGWAGWIERRFGRAA
jgi:drug/metabolite transporter superfamily protein YnfA